MTEHELDATKKAFEHALKVGAPGLSEVTRGAIVGNAILRLRHQFNVLKPGLSASDQRMAELASWVRP